jgi:mannosyltransferase
MTSVWGPLSGVPTVGTPPRESAEGPSIEGSGQRRLRAAAVWLPALAALAIGGWRITVPSLWRDESVSAVVARSPLSYMRQLMGDIDAVHALYYLLLRPFAAFGGSEFLLRLPSLIAFACTAYGIAVLGRRLVGPMAGLYGGLLYALLPMANRYAQEVRSYAIVSFVAVLATWLLVNALDSPSRRRYVGYAASVAVLGWFHLYALLLVGVHAVAVWTARPRRVLPWVLAVAGAGITLVPLVVVASGQRETQLFWLHPPDFDDLTAFLEEVAGNTAAAVVLFSLAACGVWWSRRTPVVALWAFAPILASFLISQVYPVYDPRYVLFVVPAIALLAGIGVHAVTTSLRGHIAVPIIAFVLVGALIFSAHVEIREPASRPDDLRSLSAVLASTERPGDGVLFVPQRYRLFVSVYGDPFRNLTDLTNAPGTYEPRTAAQFTAAAAGLDRVWLVAPPAGPRNVGDPRFIALSRAFKLVSNRSFGYTRLALYVRNSH